MALRHMAANSPLPRATSEGWQHSQIDLPGDWYSITFLDHVAPPSLENEPHRRLPPGMRSSSHTEASLPAGAAAMAGRTSRAAGGWAVVTTGVGPGVAPSGGG